LLRSRVGVLLGVTVVALTVAATAGCLAGARRTASAFDRFVAWSDPPNLSLGGIFDVGGFDAVRAALERSPNVERIEDIFTVDALVEMEDGTQLTFDQAAVIALSDPTMSGRLKVLEGTMPPPTALDEVAITFLGAERLGLRPGDPLTLSTADGAFPVRIGAIVAVPSEFPTVGGRTLSFLAVMPAFIEAHPGLLDELDATVAVWLRDRPGVMEAFRAEGERAGLARLDLDSQEEITAGVNRILGTDALALAIAALLAAAVGTIVLHLVMRRESDAASSDLRNLATLGMTRTGRAIGGAAVGALVGGTGAFLGAAASVAGSSFTPIGLARVAEPDPGLAVDVPVLILSIAGAVVVAAMLCAWRAARAGRIVSSVAGRTARVRGVPEPAATGIRFALSPEGAGAGGRARPGLVGLAVTVAVLVTVAVVGATLDRVRDDPQLSGGWWDGFAGTWVEGGAERLRAALDASPDVAATSRAGWLGQFEVAGSPVGVMYIDPEGGIEPVMTRGRVPNGPHEAALGAATLEASGHELGDDVTLELVAEDGTVTQVIVQVVGETVLSPPLWFTMAPGEGAMVTTEFVERWAPDDLQGEPTLINVQPGADIQSVLADLRRAVSEEPDDMVAFARSPRSDVEALSSVTTVPILLAAVLALLAAVSFVHVVLVSSRRHRRDQTILRSLGFTPAQARQASVAHSGVLAAVALLVGVPVGIFLGSIAWRLISAELVVTPRLFPPGGALVVGTVCALVLAMALGATVGSRRWRARPAALLRTE
jgi:hypothetical protein